MKNYSYIWISLIILVFGIYAVPKIVNKMKDAEVVQNDRLNVGNNRELIKIAKAPSFSFTNQNNEIISNKTYDGKVYLVEFFFTSCPTICPIMNENMVKLQNTFKFEEDFGIASFTIDPINDTPDEMKEYAKSLGATSPNWHFLTNTQDEIFALAEKFQLYAAQNDDAPGGFEHSGMFALIDKNGNIRSRKDAMGNPIVYYDGVEEEGIEMLKEDIKILLAE